jgi:hypothetical protein
MTLGEKAVELAKLRIGVHEASTNWSPFIKIYLAFVGVFFPAPWCSAFASFVIHKAAASLGIKAKWPRSGYVQSVVNWAIKNSYISTKPCVGCAFVKYHPELKRYAHIGFIAEVNGNKVLTVEGNSNTTGGREGTEVVSIMRIWTDRYRSIKIC